MQLAGWHFTMLPSTLPRVPFERIENTKKVKIIADCNRTSNPMYRGKSKMTAKELLEKYAKGEEGL